MGNRGIMTQKGDESMSHAKRMTEANQVPLDADALVDCFEASFDCAQIFIACADACLGEQDIQMLARCIRLDLDCADLCATTGKILSRRIAFDFAMVRGTVEAYAQACRLCGEERERYAEHHEHCRACAEVCRRCESTCHNLLSEMGAS